jgi:hypothetical protein
MRSSSGRLRGVATFIVLVAVAEACGRSLTRRIDEALHVAPLARTSASYYPFLLVGVKIAAALALAALLARASRAWAAASTGDRLLATVGHPHERRAPKLTPGLSLRVWLGAFAATSIVYLALADVDALADGRWPTLAPWLHTYALPVFAALAVLVAAVWRVAGWLHEVERYATSAIARVRRILTASVRFRLHYPRAGDVLAPRRRFGLSFECRPPPLAS